MSKQIEKPSRLARQQEQLDPAKYCLSKETAALFAAILTQSPHSLSELPCSEIRALCQQELERLLRLKSGDKTFKGKYLDNELTVSVVDIQARFLMEVTHPEAEENGQVELELERVETEIARFMEAEVLSRGDVDFVSCLDFFTVASHRLKELGAHRSVESRLKLMQILSFFLRESACRLQPEKALPEEEQKDAVGLSSDEANKWSRYRSGILQDKLMELSGICQQIPQLEVFNRTLQFSQLESTQKVSFLKVIGVLISLHHRVSYLSRNKPALMRELENASQEMNYMNQRVEEFLGQMGEETQQMVGISFGGLDERWKSQLSESFTEMQGYLLKLSDIVISQDNFHTDHYQKMERFLKIVEMFTKVLAGEPDVVEDWVALLSNIHEQKEDQTFTEEECRLLFLLDDCLACERSRISSPRQQNLSNRTNEDLELQVNKLIEDYERVKRDNMQLASDLEIEQRLKEELLVEVDERDSIIKNLSAKKLALEKRLKQDGNSGVSSRVKDEDMKKLEHDAQKYLESTLLLKEQLKVSEAERQKLLEMAETQKNQYLKTLESLNRLKPERERLEIECEQLRNRIESLKTQNIKHANRFNKMIADLTNQKILLEMQVDTAERNNLRLMERLDLNEKKLTQYSKLMMARLDEKDDLAQQKLEREAERLRKDLDNSQTQCKDLEHENRSLRDDIANFKLKLKQQQLRTEDESERQQLLNEIRSRLEKTQAKNNSLAKSLDEAKSREEDLEEKLKINAKTTRDAESREAELQSENKRLSRSVEEGAKRYQDLQLQLQELRSWAEKETRSARDYASKKEMQLLERGSSISTLELKIRMLEEQLLHKTQLSERTSQQLVETRMKQYDSTIETHKLIQLKLQEQNLTLKKDLDEKVQNEIKLTSQIDRLAKEIDRMKAELEKYLRELTEKELTIRIEREKNDQQLKRLREFEVKEKINGEHYSPHQEKPFHEVDTPSQFEGNESLGDSLGRSSLRYDNYFNARQYERLSKEYADFKKHATLKIDQLESSLEEALKSRHQRSSDPSEDSRLRIQLERAQQQLQALRVENQHQAERLKDLPSQIDNLKGQLQNMGTRLSEQSSNFNHLISEKKILEDKIVILNSQRDSSSVSKSREAELLKQIDELRETNKLLEQQNRKQREAQQHLKEDLERQTKNMFQHYESEMKKVIRDTDGVNSRLAAEVDSLRKQLSAQSTPSQLYKEKEGMLAELKGSIQSLLTEKNKLSQENSRLFAERSNLQREMSEMNKQLMSLRERVSVLSRQRDLIRNQHDSMRLHLQEETKRAIYLQSQLIKTQDDLQRQKISPTQGDNVDYLKAKIKALEEALAVVGEQLTDSKALLDKSKGESKGQLQRLGSEPVELQRLPKMELGMKRKEEQYLRCIQLKNREIIQLKSLIEGDRPSQRLIVTSLPNASRPSRSTYNQSTSNRSMGLIRVEKFLEGKRRWENIQFSESLGRWGVPPVVCQEIEDLRQLYLNMSQNIMAMNQEQLQIQKRLMASPSLQNLIEFMSRILTFFSEVAAGSQEAIKIKSQLEGIARQYSGGLFFTVLEEYTVHILQNNTIEQYKRDLRLKAKELLQIKEKLEELINRQLEQEELVTSQPQMDRPREPGQYVSTSLSGSPAARS